MRYPAEDATACYARVDRLARAAHTAGDPRTLNQLRADVHRDLLLGRNTSMVQTRAYVAVNASTLLGLDDLPGELRGYGPLPAERIRRMAMDMKALWSGVLVDDNGVARRLAEQRYRPSKRLAEFLQLRDQTCRQPACTRPAERCDIDHLTPHLAGGVTNEINCHCFCRRHHRCKPEGAWKVEKVPTAS